MDVMSYLRRQWDRAGAIGAVLLGLVALLLGWSGVRGTAYPAEQIPYVISGGLLGVLLVGVGAVLWLSADLRDEWRKLDSLEQAVRELTELEQTRSETESVPATNGSVARAENAQGSGRRRRAPVTTGSES